ncbi:MAG: ABC transporter ATP-binding protein [Thermoanaerobacteraceae bacterium]|nr:ABC transporter ATP-binding protein [Thermoanaerobacteraceae bacterium]
MIRAENVVKTIGSKTVLKDINLHIEPGEFVSVLGPNGAGKTTLLKVLTLLTPPSEGQVYIAGQKITGNPLALRKKMGVISHNTFLYGNLTAYENLLFYGRMYDVPNVRQRIKEVIAEVGLQYSLNDPVRTFSRGMQQRLAIARAIIHDPDILFLDEPYTGLDQHAIGILNQVLLNLTNQNRTIYMITHNFEQGLHMSDRIIILVSGRIVYEASSKSLSLEELQDIYLKLVGES